MSSTEHEEEPRHAANLAVVMVKEDPRTKWLRLLTYIYIYRNRKPTCSWSPKKKRNSQSSTIVVTINWYQNGGPYRAPMQSPGSLLGPPPDRSPTTRGPPTKRQAANGSDGDDGTRTATTATAATEATGHERSTVREWDPDYKGSTRFVPMLFGMHMDTAASQPASLGRDSDNRHSDGRHGNMESPQRRKT